MRRFVQSQSMLIVFGIIAVFIFGFWGYLDSEVLENLKNDEELHYKEQYHLLNSLYAILGMFLMAGLEPNIQNWQIAVASYLAAGVLGYGILNIIWNYAYDAIASVWIMLFYRDHTIIVGNSGIGYRIAIELLKSGSKVVVLDKQPNFDENTTKIRSLGGFVLARSGSESNDFIKAGIARAGHCLVLNTNEEENLQSINILSWLNQRKKIIHGPLKVLVNVENWNNKFFLKDYMDLYNTTENFDIDAFNPHTSAAQIIYDQYSPLNGVDYTIKKDNDGNITEVISSENTIVILGVNATTEVFIFENIILSHSPGLRNLKILLIDRDIEKKYKELKFRFPFIEEFLDIFPIELEDENFHSEIFKSESFNNDLKHLSHAYIFGDEDTYLLGIANSFRQMLYAEKGDLNRIPIILTLPEKSKILDLLEPMEIQSEGSELRLFNELKEKFNINVIRLITDTCTKTKLIDEIGIIDSLSKIINYFYSIKYEFYWLLDEKDRDKLTAEALQKLEFGYVNFPIADNAPLIQLENYVLAELAKILEKKIEDLKPLFTIDERWNSLSDLKQESNRYVARHLEIKLNFIGKMGHQDINNKVIEQYFKVFAPVEHKRWCSEKLCFNFRYGPFPENDSKTTKILKDSLKIHDQLIPYEDLSKEMEDKDFNMFLLIPLLKKVKEKLVG